MFYHIKAKTAILFCQNCGFLFGGEREIRTLGTVLAFTRFPVVRLRPAQPSLQATIVLYHKDFEKSIGFLKKIIFYEKY